LNNQNKISSKLQAQSSKSYRNQPLSAFKILLNNQNKISSKLKAQSSKSYRNQPLSAFSFKLQAFMD
jgi:hypothetical protein